jgi:hypothetical protein
MQEPDSSMVSNRGFNNVRRAGLTKALALLGGLFTAKAVAGKDGQLPELRLPVRIDLVPGEMSSTVEFLVRVRKEQMYAFDLMFESEPSQESRERLNEILGTDVYDYSGPVGLSYLSMKANLTIEPVSVEGADGLFRVVRQKVPLVASGQWTFRYEVARPILRRGLYKVLFRYEFLTRDAVNQRSHVSLARRYMGK